MLDYTNVVDFTYNPFSGVCTCCPVGYSGADCEIRIIPVSSPYMFGLYQAPVESVPSTMCIMISASPLTEVSASTCPGDMQYRVNYQEKGCGLVEFHANQAGCSICICYYHVGTILGKDTLDARLNNYCADNHALCTYAVCCYASEHRACCISLYACATCHTAIEACAGLCHAIQGVANNKSIRGYAVCCCGVVGCADINIGVYAKAQCCSVYACATTDYAIYAIADTCCAIYACGGYMALKACTECWSAIEARATKGPTISAFACCNGNNTSAPYFGYAGEFNSNATYSLIAKGALQTFSSKEIKTNFIPLCAIDCIRKYPDLQIYCYMYNDMNTRDVKYTIGIMSEDLKRVFKFADGQTVGSNVGDIALSGVIGLVKEIDELKKEINILKGA